MINNVVFVGRLASKRVINLKRNGIDVKYIMFYLFQKRSAFYPGQFDPKAITICCVSFNDKLIKLINETPRNSLVYVVGKINNYDIWDSKKFTKTTAYNIVVEQCTISKKLDKNLENVI